MRKLRKLNPEEAEQVVSNMAQTWRKMYDNARMEGLPTGEAKGKEVSSGTVSEQYLNEWQGLTAAMAMRLYFYRVIAYYFKIIWTSFPRERATLARKSRDGL
jgi:hypothetical protein